MPNIGETQVWNLVGGGSYKSAKPPFHGAYRPEDYGAVGDNSTDDFAAFVSMLNDINDDTTTDSRGAEILLDARKTYFLSDTLILDRNFHISGRGGGTAHSNGLSRLRFAAGKGIWHRARGFDVPIGASTIVENLDIQCAQLSGLLSYAHSTVYNVGDLVRFGHDRSHLFRVVRTTGDAKTSSALALSGATAEWTSGTHHNAGDTIVPSAPNQNGHIYRAINSGNSAATEPNDPRYGGWSWLSHEIVHDGGIQWEEYGIYQPHYGHYAARPFTPYDSVEVTRQNNRRYEHNAVVRIVGHSKEWSLWLWNVSGVGGTTAPSSTAVETFLTGASVGNTFTDGTVTWTAIDPFAQGLLWQDAAVLFMPEEYPAVAYRAGGVVYDNVQISGSTCDGISVYGKALAPASNVNFWRLFNISFLAPIGGCCINVRGDDANGGISVGHLTNGTGPLLQTDGVEATASFRDSSAAGATWVGCRNSEAFYGYAFDCVRSNIVGGYAEGGRLNLVSGTASAVAGSAGTLLTRGSSPTYVDAGRGIFGHESALLDDTSQLQCSLAGTYGPTSSASGLRAFGIRYYNPIGGEGGFHGPTYRGGTTYIDPGYWMWSFQAEAYTFGFSPFFFTSDLAGPWCDLRSAQIFGVLSQSVAMGVPHGGGGAPFGLHIRAALPTSNTWSIGNHMFFEAPAAGSPPGASCVATGTSGGTWAYMARTLGPADTTSTRVQVWADDSYTQAASGAKLTTKVGTRRYRGQSQTTTGTASQVIDDGGTIDGSDFTIPDNAVTEVIWKIALHIPGSANGGIINVRASFVRNGGTLAMLDSSVSYGSTGGGLTGDTSTVAPAVNVNRVELRVSPNDSSTRNWRFTRDHTIEGID